MVLLNYLTPKCTVFMTNVLFSFKSTIFNHYRQKKTTGIILTSLPHLTQQLNNLEAGYTKQEGVTSRYFTYFTVYTVWAIFKHTEAISIYEISCKNKSKLNLISRQNWKEKKSDD